MGSQGPNKGEKGTSIDGSENRGRLRSYSRCTLPRALQRWFGGPPRVRAEHSDPNEGGETDHPKLPYPLPYRKNSISKFRYSSDLHLMRLKERLPEIGPEKQYIVATEYKVCFRLNGEPRSVTVPKGMLSDLTSVPRLFRGIVGRVGPHLEAAIVHDYLYMAWQLHPQPRSEADMAVMRRFSDDLMVAAMKEAGMGRKAHAIFVAVRLFGRCIFESWNQQPLILSGDKFPNFADPDTAAKPNRPDQ